MGFIGFFLIVYLLYNIVIFLIDALLYTAIWQTNTLSDLLRQQQIFQKPAVNSAVLNNNDEKLTAIDRSFNYSIAPLFERRPKRSLDSGFTKCNWLHQYLYKLSPKTDNSQEYSAELAADEMSTIRRVVNAFPALIACTMKRL